MLHRRVQDAARLSMHCIYRGGVVYADGLHMDTLGLVFALKLTNADYYKHHACCWQVIVL